MGVVLFGEEVRCSRLGAWDAGLHLSGASETVQRGLRVDWTDLLIHHGTSWFDWLGDKIKNESLGSCNAYLVLAQQPLQHVLQ